MPSGDDRSSRAQALGAFIRRQREAANLSLRGAAERAGISNPYLSQLERGLHEPSVRVLSAVARALRVPADELLQQAGFGEDDGSPTRGDGDTESAIRRDPHLSSEQRDALLGVYRSYRAANDRAP
jgi:transcriptional regulator with XRE-family HTH domain